MLQILLWKYVLQKGEDLILLYDLPIRFEMLETEDNPTALNHFPRTDINIRFGIKYHLNTNQTTYYDPIGISNNYY